MQQSSRTEPYFRFRAYWEEILKKGHFNSISSKFQIFKKNQHKLIIDLYHSFDQIEIESF